LREVVASIAGRKWLTALMGMRPPIAGKNGEERALSASEAMGYERAVGNMAALLDDPVPQPEIKNVEIRTD
jgi:hypothetical protein